MEKQAKIKWGTNLNCTRGMKLSKIVNDYGLFDFSFCKETSDGEAMLIYNSMLSSNPHVGIVNIEKGSTEKTRKFEIKALKKYGKFSADADVKPEVSNDEIRYSKPGATKGTNGEILIYYIEKEKKADYGTLKMFFESIESQI